MTVTTYRNPKCGRSRNVLAMIRQADEEPVVIEYLKDTPSRKRLEELIDAMGIPVRALLRETGAHYAELGLGDPKWTDAELIGFRMAHPILINRPIVVTSKGVRLCRRRKECSIFCKPRPSPEAGRTNFAIPSPCR